MVIIMTDNYNNDFYNENTNGSDAPEDSVKEPASDSISGEQKQKTSSESSYEWNGKSSNNVSSGEYHYSYINGNNENAAHNPNNYDNAYSGYNSDSTAGTSSGSASGAAYGNNYTSSANGQTANQQSYGNSYGAPNGYGGYSNPGYNSQPYSVNQTYNRKKAKKVKVKKAKKPSKPVSRGFLAAVLVVTVIASAALGFGGGYLANQFNRTGSGSVNINQVSASSTSSKSEAAAGTTSSIVKKTADSVVEIATESVVTGSFARQYIQQGAGSGVIISEDGYIITNNHVIDGANNITVTLRDGSTSYNAALIGSDDANDIALLKVDATGLSPATFGDSSKLAVGDYVVAIGNPLGELGGTVTDGIISALAREVTIEDKNMTLLQTNAQISPGNSGGGLFNSSGELIGIVNAKDSATEVEGIAFAIPINNVLDIINDLKSYGYVTGKIDLGMELTDITSNETAFYYGVSQTGCYVLSVTRGSNANAAGFRTGDLITKVNGKEITTSADVEEALSDNEVGDDVIFTVYRSGKSINLELTLDEYVPSGNSSAHQSATTPAGYGDDSDDSIWSQMFGW